LQIYLQICLYFGVILGQTMATCYKKLDKRAPRTFMSALLWQNEGVSLYGKHLAETVVEKLVRPMFSEVLCRKVDGSF